MCYATLTVPGGGLEDIFDSAGIKTGTRISVYIYNIALTAPPQGSNIHTLIQFFTLMSITRTRSTNPISLENLNHFAVTAPIHITTITVLLASLAQIATKAGGSCTLSGVALDRGGAVGYSGGVALDGGGCVSVP
jgi:hypothetical protein